MAAVNHCLTAEQATAIRQQIVSLDYAEAVEKLSDCLLNDGLQEIRVARARVHALEAQIDAFGWEDKIAAGVELTVDEDDLRDWAVGAFDSAREMLGQVSGCPREEIEADNGLIAQAEALMPLIEALDHRPGLEGA